MTLFHPVTPLLQVDDLHVSRSGHEIVKGASLRVFGGTIAAIVGSAGAGKTTLLRAVARLVASRGRITFDGRRMDRLTSGRVVRWGLAYLPQDRGVVAGLTVRQNLELGATVRLDRYAVRSDVAATLDRFPDLARHADTPAELLSAGEQTILALGRALMAKPRLLLLDEPSTGLPPEGVAEVFAIIMQLNGQGLPILLAEQYERKALAISDYIYVMDRGAIVKEGLARAMALEPEIEEAHFGAANVRR